MTRRLVLNPVLIDDDAEFNAWLDRELDHGMPLGRALSIAQQREQRLSTPALAAAA